MKIFINVKSLGKKKRALTPIPYEIPDHTASLRELLTALVRIEVEKYREKAGNSEADENGGAVRKALLLSHEEMEAQADAGKVGFGRIYSHKLPDAEKAAANALQCYEDGLIRVFHGDVELEGLEAPLQISEGDTFTLIRLAMLSGRMW